MKRAKATVPRLAVAIAALASLFPASVASAAALACPEPVLAVELPDEPDRSGAPIYVEARRFDAYVEGQAEARGNVRLQRADQTLDTEELRYNPESGVLALPEPLRYRDARYVIDAQRGEYALARDSGTFEEVQYGFKGATAHGSAERVRVEEGTRTYLIRPRFTTCPGEEPAWLIRAGEVEFRHDEGVGIARHARLEFMQVPILYAPWFSFPIDDRRKSGFLYPEASIANDNGIEIGIPYYWNIAPNQDATITPRYFTDRGLMLTGEYRMLTRRTGGTLNFDYLHHDKQTRDDRFQVRLRHGARLNPAWQSRISIDRVSDDEYFQDFGSSLAQTARQFLRSSGSIQGRGRYWSFTATTDSFQVIDESVSESREPYRRLPRLLFDLERPLGATGLEAALESELVYFDRDVGTTGARLDLFPRIGWGLASYWGFLRASAGYRYTAYSLDRQGAGGNDTPDRGLPIASLDGGVYFERDQGDGWIQTLEPRVFYLYVPYEDQSNLPDFDTTEFTFGYSQLFHSNRFTSADRQSNANQVTLAVNSRSINPTTGRERWSFAAGQIFYFERQKVRLGPSPPESDNRSPFIAEFNWIPFSRFSGRIGAQWNWEEGRFDVWALGMDYRSLRFGRVGFEYRFRRDRLDQFDVRYLWPINERWTVLTRLKYSVDDREPLETQAGIEYESCCWGLRLIARRYLRNREGDARDAIYLELRLKGLGDFGREPPPLFYDEAD